MTVAVNAFQTRPWGRWNLRYSPQIAAGIVATIDFVTIIAAGILACWLSVPRSDSILLQLFVVLIISATIAVLCLASLRSYNLERLNGRMGETRKILVALALVHFLAYLELTQNGPSEMSLFVWRWQFLIFSSASVLAVHHLLFFAMRALAKRNIISRHIAIVGCGEQGTRVLAGLLRADQPWTRIVGVFDDRGTRVPQQIAGHQRRGTTGDLLTLASQVRIDEIFIALPWTAEERIGQIFRAVQALPANIHLGPDLAGSAYSTRPYVWCNGIQTLSLLSRPQSGWRGVAKILEDYVIASLAMLLLLPVMCFIAIAIKIETPGPVLFRQRRIGWNNCEFDVFKFRTMFHAPSASGVLVQTARQDPRVTKVGWFLRRTSLDELPQILNVLLGNMSIVGPRPHATNMRTEDRLCCEIVGEYAHRHRVKPGITGWAQVSGYRGAADTEAHLRSRIELDLFYIDNWSLLFDLKILWLTCGAVLARENAF